MTISELYRIFLAHPQVVTDSRKVTKGCLFFALRGDSFDGNSFIPAALEAGAAYAVSDCQSYRQTERVITVDSVLHTLQQLANHHRKELQIPVLAITGSNGKTTTKELVSRVLAKKYRVAVTQGNLNNHIGVPLTLLAIPTDAELAVIEMGTNHFGEIVTLCELAEPTHGLITNVGKAHLEFFGSLAGVEKAKGELLDYLSLHGGVPFYSSDSDCLQRMVGARSFKHTEPFSRGSFGIQAEPCTAEQPFIRFTLAGGKQVVTSLLGSYNIDNVLAALAVARYFSVSEDDALAAIASYSPENNRSQLSQTANNSVYLDAYNANPTSMEAAIRSFYEQVAASKLLILGDMGELGEQSEAEHLRILDLLQQLGFTDAYLVGHRFAKAAAGLPFKTFHTTDDLCIFLASHPVKGRSVLVKASRSIGLEKVMKYL